MSIAVPKDSTFQPANNGAKKSAAAGREGTASDPLDQLIWYLGRAYYTYVGVLEKMLDEAGLKKHVQPGMGHILFALFSQDDLTIKEIARRSKLANSTLTGLLNRMETGKLIESPPRFGRRAAGPGSADVAGPFPGAGLSPGCGDARRDFSKASRRKKSPAIQATPARNHRRHARRGYQWRWQWRLRFRKGRLKALADAPVEATNKSHPEIKRIYWRSQAVSGIFAKRVRLWILQVGGCFNSPENQPQDGNKGFAGNSIQAKPILGWRRGCWQ